MSTALKVLTGVAIAFVISGDVTGQGLVMQRNLSLPMAKTIAEATLAECKAKGFNTAAAVVDRAGQVLDPQGPADASEREPVFRAARCQDDLHELVGRGWHLGGPDHLRGPER